MQKVFHINVNAPTFLASKLLRATKKIVFVSSVAASFDFTNFGSFLTQLELHSFTPLLSPREPDQDTRSTQAERSGCKQYISNRCAPVQPIPHARRDKIYLASITIGVFPISDLLTSAIGANSTMLQASKASSKVLTCLVTSVRWLLPCLLYTSRKRLETLPNFLRRILSYWSASCCQTLRFALCFGRRATRR
ncbi:hypothetical protein V1506DRAFT_182280 [Lipomyces tetrasporus]